MAAEAGYLTSLLRMKLGIIQLNPIALQECWVLLSPQKIHLSLLSLLRQQIATLVMTSSLRY